MAMRCPAVLALCMASMLSGVVTAADEQPIVVMALGDSITRGVRPGVDDQQTFASQLQMRLRENNHAVRVINVGIGGETTAGALKRLSVELDKHQPHMVTIMYGTNDCYVDSGATASRVDIQTFRKNLRRIVERVLQAGAEPIVMTEPRYAERSPPNGLGEHCNVRLAEYMEATRQVARQCGVPLIDHFHAWSEAVGRGVDLLDWTTDGYHPNPAGHREMAQGMAAAIHERLTTQRRLPFQQWKRRPLAVAAWQELPQLPGKVLAQPGALYIVLEEAPPDDVLRLPRLDNIIQRVWWWPTGEPETSRHDVGVADDAPFVPPAQRMLQLTQGPAEWTVTLSAGLVYPLAIVLDMIDMPRVWQPDLPIAAGDDGVIVLPASRAQVYGEKLQFEPLYYKNTVGYWVNPEDYVSWSLVTEHASQWQVELLQGCGTGQGGSQVQIEIGPSALPWTVEETGHFQNFRWRTVGRVPLDPGRHELRVRCTQLARNAVMDIRQIRLVPVEPQRRPIADCHDVAPDLWLPPLTDGPPAAGRRFIAQAPEYEKTDAYHVVSLPTDWASNGQFPVIVEFTGNGPFVNEYGDYCSGRVEDASFGLGIGGGDGFIWLSLPLLNDAATANVRQWWGDAPDYRVQPTLDYARSAIDDACRRFGGDRTQVVLAGFSRGALAASVIGLHNADTARMWRAMILCSHYDGARRWPYPQSQPASAVERLARLGSIPQYLVTESLADGTDPHAAARAIITEAGVLPNVTFAETGFVNHTDIWALRPSPARTALREWLRDVLQKEDHRTTASKPDR